MQFWQARSLGFWPNDTTSLFPSAPDLDGLPATLTGLALGARLREEQELFGFIVSGHPLDLHATVDWNSYCRISRLGEFAGQRVTVCGLIIAERMHGQATGGDMKFINLVDYTGFIECEIFAQAYRLWGLATIRWPVVEVEGTVSPFENGNGFTLDARRVGKPRLKGSAS